MLSLFIFSINIGEAIIHGYCDNTEAEVLFELQNLTEVGLGGFHASELHVGLCGLAYRARLCAAASRDTTITWQPLEQTAPSRAAHENDWRLRGRVIAFKPVCNPLSGSELYWVYVDLDRLKLEILVNRRSLRGPRLAVGVMIAAEVWLQGHVLDHRALLSRYEGLDRSTATADFWRHLKRTN